jgi:polygalacturonase
MKEFRNLSTVKLLIGLVLLQLVLPQFVNAQQYNIVNSGAIGDGKTDNTSSIQKAIDSCAVTGGQVYVPKGVFLTGTIILKSNVTLHVAAGATLLGQQEAKFYPFQNSGIPFYGEDWAKQALIYCKNQTNVGIEGKGTIDGQGAAFQTSTLKKPDRYKNRPYLLWFAGCENVSVTGVQLRNSAFWMQHYLGCKRVRIDGISVWNHSNKNNDLMDIDGCSFVTISNVIGDADDDGITIKSTSPLVSEYITITNCILSSHCNAIKFGTESVGGFRNITISNCVIKPSAQLTTIYGKPAGISGLSMEIVDGGIMENITIDNLAIDGAEVPIFVRLGNRARKHVASAPTPGLGVLRNISIANVVATRAGITGCSISGISKAPVENVTLSNITMELEGGGKAADASRTIEELEDLYPEASMFGQLPAAGFYIRHAKGIKLSDIQLHYKTPEQRPAFFVSDVDGFSILNINSVPSPGSEATVWVENSKNGLVTGSGYSSSARNFIKKDRLSKNVTGKIQ